MAKLPAPRIAFFVLALGVLSIVSELFWLYWVAWAYGPTQPYPPPSLTEQAINLGAWVYVVLYAATCILGIAALRRIRRDERRGKWLVILVMLVGAIPLVLDMFFSMVA